MRVEAEDMRTGVRQHCCSANLIFVALPTSTIPSSSSSSSLAAAGEGGGSGKRGGSARPTLPRVVPSCQEDERVYAGGRERERERAKIRSPPSLCQNQF